MNPGRIATTFEQLAARGRKALIPYVTAGFPFADITPALMHGMVSAGADVIELGVPFSDPMADGPPTRWNATTRSMERAHSCAMQRRPASMACSSSTTRPRNAKPLLARCERMAWT